MRVQTKESIMKRRNLLTGAVLGVSLFGLAAVGTVIARPHGGVCDFGLGASAAALGGDWGHGGHRLHRLLRGLDLTEAQRDQVFQIMHQQMPAAREKMKALREGRQALRDAAMGQAYDAQQVRALADAQAKHLSDLIVMRTETFNKVYALLTPEQQAKVAEWKEQRRGRRPIQ
jgi:Spy/CpxP family protein refolding chaperone